MLYRLVVCLAFLLAFNWFCSKTTCNANPCPDSTCELYRAIQNQNLEHVKRLIDQGTNPNSKYGRLPVLIYAIETGQLSIVKYLVEQGAEAYAFTNYGHHGEFYTSPLITAAKQGYLDIVKYLVYQGAGLNSRGDKHHTTPLILAATRGDLEMVKYLVTEGARVDLTEEHGRTALLEAALRGHDKVVQFLLPHSKNSQEKLIVSACLGDLVLLRQNLKKKIDLNLHMGRVNALKCAVLHSQLEAVKYLLNQGADANALDPVEVISSHGVSKDTVPPLQWGIQKYSPQVIQALIGKGANILAQDPWGNSYLTKAAEAGQLELIQDWYIRTGIKPSNDQQSLNALFKATENGHLHIVDYFLNQGMNVNHLNESANSLLEKALKFKENDFLFIEINTSLPSKIGKQPLNTTENELIRQRLALLKSLIKRGANVDISQDQNATPFEIAINEYTTKLTGKNYRSILELFYEHSTDLKTRLKASIHLGILDKVKSNLENRHSLSDSDLNEVLEIALKQKQIEVGTYFLSLKEISETELNIAIEAGSLKTVQFILEKKPELQILLHNNQELFLQALSTRQADLIQFFFDQGIVLDKKQPQVIQTLFDAVERKNKLLLNCLIKNGADPNSTTETGWTLLSQAVFENDLEMVKYLHLKGAELDLNDGSALFNAALGDDRFETLKYLIDNGAKVNIKDQKGFFPLFASSATGSFNNVKYLIEHGADPTLKNHQGETVLMNEWPCGNLELIEYLMQHGADIDAQDNAGRSVFDHFSACMQSHMVNRGLVKSEYVYFPPEIWED